MIPIAFCQTNRLFILLERAEKEIRFSLANGMFKIKMDIDHHGPRRMPDNCKNLNPPYFLLPSTFKGQFTEHELFKSQKPVSAFRDKRRASILHFFYNRFELGIEFAFYVPISNCKLLILSLFANFKGTVA